MWSIWSLLEVLAEPQVAVVLVDCLQDFLV
jgi:hypothetical protein